MHSVATISRSCIAVAGLTIGIIANAGSPVEAPYMTIGTGDVIGVYYASGGAICNLVDKHRDQHGVRCLVESTSGSIANLEALRQNKLDLGIVQADWQHHAYKGTSIFQDEGPFTDLRAVFSLHTEPFTVVARADSSIRTFTDLKGKRVNIGNPGSGQRNTMETLMQAMGWTHADFSEVLELSPADQSQALCDGQVDAIVFTVGHPNSSIFEATTACDSVLVEVSGSVVDALVSDKAYYILTSIPGGMYRGNPEDVTTFGVMATVVASVNTSAETVYLTTRSVFENFEEFRQLHPTLNTLNRDDMVNHGNSAPLHAGAERYFREAGLLE